MKTIEFKALEKALRGKKIAWRALLAPAPGAAAVITISRDGCKGCELQKPALEKLAAGLAVKHGKRLTFSLVHVAWAPGSAEDSLRSKRLLGHYFYPCTVILISTKDLGPAEYYRCGSPSSAELKKYCTRALRAAEAVK